MSTEPRARAWLEVRSAALRANAESLRSALPETTGLIPMVKADGYGLGMLRAAQALEPLGPIAFGVATVEEGLRLRRAYPDVRVLVCSPVPPGSVPAAVEGRLELSVSDLATLRRLEDVGRGASFHLDVDTGMGRSGFDWRRVVDWGPVLAARSDGIRWVGAFTHFHSADSGSRRSVDQQWQRFNDTMAALDVPDDPSFLVHVCNSAAALRCPDLGADAVRPGIYLYGGRTGEGVSPPRAVATLRARILLIKDAPPGATLGYGSTYRAGAWERWATVGLGYGDGLPRALGNRGHGIVRGRRVPIIGRISMDVTVVDITGLDGVSTGDVVTFMGRDGKEEITPDDIAGHAGTISYEILTGLTPRVPRIWIDDGGP